MTSSDAGFQRSSLTWLCYAMLGWYAYAQGAINPIMPLLRRDLDLSFTVSSLHASALALGMMSAGVLGDVALRRFGIRRVLWGGSVGMVLGILLLTGGTIAPMTIAGAYLMGMLGTIAIIAVSTSLVALHGRFGAVAITESNIVASLTAALVPLAVGYFEGSGSTWRFALLAVIALWMPLLALSWRARLPVTPPVKPGEQGRLPRIAWLYLVIQFLGVSVEWGIWLWAADYLIVHNGVDAATAASMVALFPLGAVTGRIIISRLQRRHEPHTLIPYTMLVVFVGFPLFYLGETLIVNGAGLLILGMGAASLFPLAFGSVTNAAAPNFGRATSLVSLSSGSAILINPPILGLIADAVGIRTAYLLVLVLALLALGLALLANRDYERLRAQQVDAAVP